MEISTDWIHIYCLLASKITKLSHDLESYITRIKRISLSIVFVEIIL